MTERRIGVGWVTLLAAASLGGCTCGAPSGPPTASDEAAVVYALGVDVPFAQLTIPQDSRPHAPEAPEKIALSGWVHRGESYATLLPIQVRSFYFSKPLDGMTLVRADGTVIPHRYLATGDLWWEYDRVTLKVRGLDAEPQDGDLFFTYAPSTAAERRLNLRTSGLADPELFVRTSVAGGTAEDGYETRRGLLLPAPSEAVWDVTVPPAAELRFSATLAPAEVRDGPASDGATITVSFTPDGGDARTLWTGTVTDFTFQDVRIALDDAAGQVGALAVRTDPGTGPTYDYVFLADPVLMSRKAAPKHVVLVFVDTLRPDHLSAYGYERDTSPGLTAVAAAGARFTEARSVAPWTLPSARTMITGREPELFDLGGTLQGALVEQGWATAMFAGNLYLGPNFGLNRDWGTHFVELLPPADEQLDRALGWLAQQDGRDAFMLVHLMDAHLPYKEPEPFLTRWAGPRPASLEDDEFRRGEVTAARLKSKEDRQYVRDRYDQAIAWTDSQLQRLYDALGPDDAIVFVSDHGEEFWEHGSYEHGHALWDELLRIPLVIRAPGLPAGTVVDAPVSMLDVAPTLADLAGVELPGATGRSLLPAARGDADALAALVARDVAFGRPLYGRERWGVLHAGDKYSTIAGRELVFDLAQDPKEKRDLTAKDPSLAVPFRAALATALDREVGIAWRVSNAGTRQPPDQDLVIRLTVPGGVRAAWPADEPTESSSAQVVVSPDGTTVEARWPAGWRGERDVWVMPVQPVADLTRGLSLTVAVGDVSETHTVPADAPTDVAGEKRSFYGATTGARAWSIGFGVTPLPVVGGKRLSGHDASLTSQLSAAGYVTGREAPPDGDTDSKP